MIKLGSLFDGSGGFPLAGALFGVEPVWASEIEPFPIRVTKQRFPNMKHLGSVTDVHGDQIEPVDIITFGSPCQDLSIAGKQAGIHDGKRSNLFFEAIRIIKEMRHATSDKYPRFALWENVQGAFSSNGGADFRAVLQAFCDADNQGIPIPEHPKRGRWTPAGAIVGNGFSLAWRIYDAQFWGVAQRRKRIYLIADFGSERAGEILFESESLPGHLEPSGAPWKAFTGNVEGSVGGSDNTVYCLQGNGIDRAETAGCNGKGWSDGGVSYTLNTIDRPAVVCFAPEGNHCGAYREDRTSATLQTKYHYGSGGDAALIVLNDQGGKVMDVSDKSITLRAQEHGHQPIVVYDARGNGNGGVCPTLTGDHENRITDYTAIAVSIGNGQLHQMNMEPIARPLDCMHDQQAILTEGKPPRKYIVRRLTPTECGRLQGFPDGWCDGAEGSDSAIYKMWGNGIALPCAADVMGRLVKELEK